MKKGADKTLKKKEVVVSLQNWKFLMQLKIVLNKRSVDSVISHLKRKINLAQLPKDRL